jgi:Fe-S-cluster containining protein
METERRAERLTLIPVTPLPQCVPSRACFSCDVCCRFPEPDSFLRPYFTAAEIRAAVAHGVDQARFPDPAGSQIALVPNESGEGYLCPAFDPVTSHCRIYEARPLDCQIYPLALMWSADRREVVLGWDTKCPFLRDSPQGLDAHAERVAALIEREDMLETLARNPRLIGRFQDDVVVLRSLPELSKRLTDCEALGARREGGTELGDPLHPTPHLSPLTLRPLTLADRPRFETAVALVETPLAHYAFAPHFIWRGLLDYGWTEFAGHLCLFAVSPDGLFMPLPPLGPRERFAEAVPRVFSFMRERNRSSAVTRIENVPEELRPPFESMGYVLKPKDPDYLYRTADLVELAGDRYKSQRAAYNQFVRTQTFSYEPYRDEDREDCLALYRIWMAQQEARGRDDVDRTARWMLQDAASAHAEALAHHRALGLTGRVARINGTIRAYTFGYTRTAAVFCCLLEVADRSVPGLAQFIFRELCREAAALGYASINTLDDSGLPGLARSKQAYHPIGLVPSYVATEPQQE